MECESPECPVSAITPRAKRLVAMAMEARHVHGASGASYGGPDSSQWHSAWFDVVATIERARIEEHNARVRAEAQKIRSS